MYKLLLAFVVFVCFLTFAFVVGKRQNDLMFEKSKMFCQEKGFSDYAKCNEWWIVSGEYKK